MSKLDELNKQTVENKNEILALRSDLNRVEVLLDAEIASLRYELDRPLWKKLLGVE